VENEDMLAITKHNQQMRIKNAQLEKLTEEPATQRDTDREQSQQLTQLQEI